MIIDPRAGHGAGIGGFKPDSQVGVALRAGHPVYFVAFRPHPEPGQTLADVTRAEAAFVKEIARRHPDIAPSRSSSAIARAAGRPCCSPRPIPTSPGRSSSTARRSPTGPAVSGENPMRYNGGLLGGALPALLLADLGHGEFDGAHLVANFEQLNPGRNNFRKYYDLFADRGGRTARRFLEFERWWGGFHFLTEAEIRWIVEQLFVGNRLARGEARIVHGRRLDLRIDPRADHRVRELGDNITPPQQALDWIVDTYADEHEIRIRGQRDHLHGAREGRPSRDLRLLLGRQDASIPRSPPPWRPSRRWRPASTR